MLSSRSEEWKKAMQQKYVSLIKNHTWMFIDPPNERKIIPCKWIFKTKSDTNNDSIRYKARLVIKGCQQKKGHRLH